MDLLEETLEMLRKDARSYNQLAAETGLNRDWLQALKLGRIDDPGVKKIERLNAFLKEVRAA